MDGSTAKEASEGEERSRSIPYFGRGESILSAIDFFFYWNMVNPVTKPPQWYNSWYVGSSTTLVVH